MKKQERNQKIGYDPQTKIVAANNKPRWQWALESKSCLYILGLLNKSEKKNIEKRLDKWLSSWGLELTKLKATQYISNQRKND